MIKAKLEPDGEALDVFGLDLLHREVIDPRLRRSPAHMFNHRQNCFTFASEMGLKGAVSGIMDPARDAERARLLERPLAEEDALHPPEDANLATDELSHGG